MDDFLSDNPLPLLPDFNRTAASDNVDDYIKAEMHHSHIPGLSLAVVHEGKIVTAKGYGLANIETNTPATPETVYKTASIGKQFLAAGIMLLADAGKIGLDDKISNYLDGSPETWIDITIRHLLTHTSGFVEDGLGFDGFKLQSDAEVIQSAYPVPLLFTPGEKWSYSNLGYYVLAEIITQVTHRPWSEYITEHIFIPAGMTATRTTTTTEIVPHRASGYEWNHDQQENAENWAAVRPSGAFLSTVLDMAKWDAALSSDVVLTSSVREQMWTPVTLNDGTTSPYGFGWFSDSWQGHRRVHHMGGLPGFVSDYVRFIDDKLSVIVLINTTNADPEKMAHTVAGFSVPALMPPSEKAIPDTKPELTAKFNALIASCVAGHLDMSLFTPETASRLTDTLKSQVSDDLRNPGPIQSITLVESTQDGDNSMCRYQRGYRHYSLFVRCGFDKNKKIIGLGIPQ